MPKNTITEPVIVEEAPEVITPQVDISEVLDAVKQLAEMVAKAVEKNEVTEPVVVEETIEVPEALGKDDIMAMIRTMITEAMPAPVKEEAPVEEVVVAETPVENVVHYYKAPVEVDFEDKDEYQKALAGYNALVESIKENVEPEEVAELVVKGLTPDPNEEVEKPSFEKIWNEAGAGLSLEQLLQRTGVN